MPSIIWNVLNVKMWGHLLTNTGGTKLLRTLYAKPRSERPLHLRRTLRLLKIAMPILEG